MVTWNMHRAEGDLVRLLDDLSSGRLTGSAGDRFVVLLQEVTEEVLRGLPVDTGTSRFSTFFTPVLAGPERTTGNAILSTERLSDGRAIDLPRERQPRAAAAASIEIGGERLFVVSAHLENRLAFTRGLFGDGARRRQADALIAALPAGAHGVLGGDMNTMLGPGEAALDVLFDRFDDTPRGQEPTFRDRLVLDHLFFDVPDGWRIERRVIPERYGSDHHPVLGVIIPR